ncbi:MAG: helix-turn-helix domain-containing protein [Bacteroidaceae bacterium]|jgi:transcriptional regulator with XRE-family HTH domain|nr:helix-turn-helix domain-containing protein [Bacteroidaceae bacterium]
MVLDDKDRIIFLIHEKGLTNVEFSALTGVAPATISHITSGRSKPTLQVFKGILNGFPDLNSEWVFLGTGPMYKNNKVNGEAGESAAQSSSDTPDLFSGLQSDDSSNSANGRYNHISPRMLGYELRDAIKESMTAVMSQQKRQITEVRIFFDDGTYEAFSTPKPKP